MFKKTRKKVKLFMCTRLAYLFNFLSNNWTRLRVYDEEKVKELEADRPIVYAVWHGSLWIPLYYFRGSNYLVLASLSRDGEYISRILIKYGYQLVRGSSSKGGGRALLKLIKKIKAGNSVFITPDGPRGPARKAKAGIVYLQEKTNAVIIPIGIAVKNKRTMSSWDQMVLPLPGTRAALVYGEPLYLPVDKSITERAVIFEKAINATQEKAESML